MAANGRSNLHNDAYMTDTYAGAGPLGRDMERRSTFFAADCASVTFDRAGRIVTICVGVDGPRLVLLDPRTLDQLAEFPLPPRQPGAANPFTDFAGGGYFYLDNRDRAVIPTTTRHIWVVEQTVRTARARVRARPRLRRERLARRRRQALLGAAGLGGPDLVGLPARRRRHHRSGQRRGPHPRHERADHELVRGRRDGRRVHRLRRGALPVRGRRGRHAHGHLAAGVSEQRRAKARPGRAPGPGRPPRWSARSTWRSPTTPIR